MTALNSTFGGTIIVREGTYSINADIVFSKQGTQLIADGKVTLKASDTFSGIAVVRLGTFYYSVFKNFIIDCNNKTSVKGISFAGGSPNSIVQSNTIINCVSSCIYCATYTSGRIIFDNNTITTTSTSDYAFMSYCSDIIITNNSITTSFNGINAYTNTLIANNTIKNMGSVGTIIGINSGLNNIIINNILINGSGGLANYGIDLVNSNTIVASNTITDYWCGIYRPQNTASNLTIVNNIITGTLSTASFGVWVLGSNILIDGNIFSGIVGLYKDSNNVATDVIVSNNIIRNAKDRGMFLPFANIAVNIKIENNIIDGVTASATTAGYGAGISIYNVSVVTISNNQILNSVYGVYTANSTTANTDFNISNNMIRDCDIGLQISGTRFRVNDNTIMRGTGLPADYTEIQNTIAGSLTRSMVINNLILGKNLILTSTTSIVKGNKWDDSTDDGSPNTKPATKTIGTVLSGHTATEVDFLCTGTNDQTVFASAYAAVAIGGEIKVREGEYHFSAQFSFTKRDVTLSGIGKVIIYKDFDLTSSTACLINIYNTNFYFNNLIFDGNKTNYTSTLGYGIRVSNANSDSSIRNCTIQNFCCPQALSSTTIGYIGPNIYDSKFLNNTQMAFNLRDAIVDRVYVYSIDGSIGWMGAGILNNSVCITAASYVGTSFFRSGTNGDLTFSNNTFTESRDVSTLTTSSCIVVQSSLGHTTNFFNNTFNNYIECIGISTFSATMNISNNTFNGPGSNTTQTSFAIEIGKGIWSINDNLIQNYTRGIGTTVTNYNDCILSASNNIIRNCSGYGMYFAGNTNCRHQIDSNHIYDCGIGISKTYDNPSMFTNNMIKDCTSGITLASGNTVSGNSVYRGTGTITDYTETQYTIRVSGTNNIITNNFTLGKAITITSATNNIINNNKWSLTEDDAIHVVQTTGTSTTDVMSQKAVTDALSSAGGVTTFSTIQLAGTGWDSGSSENGIVSKVFIIQDDALAGWNSGIVFVSPGITLGQTLSEIQAVFDNFARARFYVRSSGPSSNNGFVVELTSYLGADPDPNIQIKFDLIRGA